MSLTETGLHDGSNWPYGVNAGNVNEVSDWATNRGLHTSKANGCIHWLRTGRCGVVECKSGPHSRPWMDHVSAWRGWDRKSRLLLAQPYHLYRADLVDIAEYASGSDLRVFVHAKGWYSSETTAVEIWWRRP